MNSSLALVAIKHMNALNRTLGFSLVWACTLALPGSVLSQTVTEPTEQATQTTERVSPAATVAPSPQFQIPPATLSGLFKDTVRDFRRLSSQDSLTWLGVGAVAAAFTLPVDDRVSQTLSASPRLGDALEPGRTIGGAFFQMGSATAVYTLGRLTRSPQVTLVGADLLQAQVLAQALTAAVKVSVRRDRPD